ncbi:MAG: NAD(+)/NADH kinase [Gemmatimonadales bacterium]|nr:NAD(+)/NADH kinase [Gemmatimonadales bacterium]
MLLATPDKCMIVVITNKAAGTGEGDRVTAITEAFAGSGATPSILEADGPDLTDTARKAIASGARVVVAAGGDGTVNAIATAVIESGAVLGVLPMGTLNHFAKDAGIPLELPDAARAIVEGEAINVDVGTVNERIFLNNSSIGVYPLMVRERDRQRSRLARSKWWAMVRSSLALFRRFPTLTVGITADGRTSRCRTPAVLLGNNVYEFSSRGLGTRDALDAGRLGLYVVRSRTPWSALGLFVNALFRRLDADGLCDVSTCQAVTLEPQAASLDVSLDGEVVKLQAPLEYGIRPKALRLIGVVAE